MSVKVLGHFGGYRKMFSFGWTCLVYHATTLFCRRNYNYKNDALGKTVGQMVGAARSARQNIVEASSRAATSKEQELKQLDVAKGSLDELAGDYEAFIVDAGEAPWSKNDERYQAVRALELDAFTATDDLDYEYGLYTLKMRQRCAKWLENEDPLIAANAQLVVIRRACSLLTGQMQRTADDFTQEGGFTERMSAARLKARDAAVQAAGAPKCPNCGKPMRKMICRKGRNAGNAFWSCTGYPECKGTRAFPAFVLCLLSFVLPLVTLAAPFAEWFSGTSPRGASVRVWGRGDEYSIHYEAEDGHAVVKDLATRTYFYARQEADGALVSTGIAVGDETDADRAVLAAIPLHLRDTSAAAREARGERIRKFDGETDRAVRWAKLKETTRRVREARKGGLLMAPPESPTAGTVKGLTVLIDFPIEGSTKTTWETVHPSVTVEQLDELLNGENCTLYGNASSVRSYYSDASNGRLDYSMVVIGPIVAPKPRTHYDDPLRDNGECARELIYDIFKIVWGDSNFTTKYLPLLQSLSTLDGKVRSLNIWFAGESAEEWSYGLWAHKWLVGSTISEDYKFTVGGKTVQFGNYQITPITSMPGIYTFCHENGHMLCGFPDLYVYEGAGNGAGYFTLMVGSTDKKNPPYFDAYLRTAAGWVEPQLLPPSGGTVTVRNNHKDVWKYENPSNPKEYYLIENRQQKGRDASIRGSGILIWRCNEDGNNEYPGSSELSGFDERVHRLNYELSLEQADGDYELETDMEYPNGDGDKWDPWYSDNAYSDGVFNDESIPTAQWKDASDSGLELSNFSSNGDTMMFDVAGYSGAAATLPLATALDNTELEFSTSAKYGWVGQTTTTHFGGSAAKSGAIGNSQSTWMQTTVTGPGTLSFAWMVSSESGYDYLEFAIDGEVQQKISGSQSWTTKTYSISEGLHVVSWTYRKDGSSKSGDDAGYVDKVVWTPDAKVAKPVISGPSGADYPPPATVSVSCATTEATIRYTLDGTDPTETSAVYVEPISIEGDVEIRVRAFKDGLAPSAITSAAYFARKTPNAIFGSEGIEWTNSEIPWREEGVRTLRAGGLKGEVSSSYVSTLTATVKGRGILRFRWRVCSYSGYNSFTFKLGGTTKITKKYANDETDYEGEGTYEVTSTAGETFTWTYTVNSINYDYGVASSTQTGAWLSDVVWEPAEKVATPVIAGPDASFFDGHADVAVSCATAGATIRYTLDGSDPTESSPAVSGGTIRITDSGTLKVRAYKDGMGASDIAMAQYVKRPVPGVWTTESEIVRQFAATDGRMICVAKLNDSLAAWSTLGPILTGERFLSWAAANGIYLVKWDNRADPSGTSASATWFKALYAQRGTGSMYNWEMCFARPSSPDTLCGYARAYDSYSVGTVEYDKTVPGVIAGFASILYDNGLMPTPIIAASEIGPFLQTPNFEWHNDSPLSWRDEQSGPTNLLHVGGFVGTAYTATLSATVADQGTLTFDYKVVSANAANTFALKVNGNPAFDARSAGTFSGTETVKVLLNGPATIEWVYTVGSAKDEKSTSGVWISNVKWVSAKTPSGRVRPYVRATWKNGKTTYERIEE